MSLLSVAGKVVMVTGGGSGIGAATAQLFNAERATVHVLDLGEQAARGVVDALDPATPAFAHAADVADAGSLEAAFRSAIETSGRIDALVNSAGVAHVGTLLSTDEPELDRVLRVNVKGTYQACRVAVRHMIENGGGSIVNLASIASLIGLEDRFAYSVSKGAVLALTRSIAADYLKHGIRCNCICPARVHTPFVDGFLKANYPGREAEMFAQLSAYQPLGRMGRPDEVATMALYLCSEAASFITGQALPMDGGVLFK